VFLKLWSAALRSVVLRRFRKKNISNMVSSVAWIVSGTERMKNTLIHVCDKSASVGLPSAEIRRISSFYNLLFFSHYFRKYFKWVYFKNVVMVTLTTGILYLYSLAWTFGFGEFYERWVARVFADRLWSGSRLPKVRETGVLGCENKFGWTCCNWIY
jgi:hypothetical protein